MRYLTTFLVLLFLYPGDAATAEESPTHRVSQEFAILHAGPSYSSEVLRELPEGTQVAVQETSGEWARIGRGWVLAEFLEPLSGDVGVPSSTVPTDDAGESARAIPGDPSLEAALRDRDEARRALRVAQSDLEDAKRRIGELEEELARRSREKPPEPEPEPASPSAGAGTPSPGELREQWKAECDQRLDSAVESAREQERRAAERDREKEVGRRVAELEEQYARKLQEEVDRLAREKDEEVQDIREQERKKMSAWLDEMDDLRRRQKIRERERAESHVETMHEAALRKQKLILDREKKEELAALEEKLNAEHAAELLRATQTAEGEFQNRLEMVRSEERKRHEDALRALKAQLDLDSQDTADSGSIRRQERERCDLELAALRSSLQEKHEKELRQCRNIPDRGDRRRRGSSRNSVDQARAAGPVPLDVPVEWEVDQGGSCDETVRKALETARAQWQAETAGYVERAVAEERARCQGQ